MLILVAANSDRVEAKSVVILTKASSRPANLESMTADSGCGTAIAAAGSTSVVSAGSSMFHQILLFVQSVTHVCEDHAGS